MHQMQLLGDVSHVESRFGQFGDGLVLMQDRYGLCQMYHRLKNHFGCTLWDS